MFLSRDEKEKLVLEFYYEKGLRYRDIAKELRMSPNQISDIIKRHEEKSNAEANNKKELSPSSKSCKMFSRGKSSLEVKIMLDIPQDQVSQFHWEYWKLIGQDKLVKLHALLGDRIFSFFKLYEELIIKRKMNIERVANLVETDLDRLPYVETQYEQACVAVGKKREEFEYLENRIRTLEERSKIVTLPSSSYHYANEGESSSSPSKPSSLPYSPLENNDPWSEYRNKRNEFKKECV
jgi:predicted DNA-binding protein YlxM (UPF0122 family)